MADVAAAWDRQAATFDIEPDHGLRDADVRRRAWRTLLNAHLPVPPTRIADLGCGTGSLAVLLAEEGHHVTGTDFSSQMLAQARGKAAAAGVSVDLALGRLERSALVKSLSDERQLWGREVDDDRYLILS